MRTELVITVPTDMPLGKTKAYIESQYVEWMLRESRYNQSKAANNMGISRGCLRAKLKEHFGDRYCETRG